MEYITDPIQMVYVRDIFKNEVKKEGSFNIDECLITIVIVDAAKYQACTEASTDDFCNARCPWITF